MIPAAQPAAWKDCLASPLLTNAEECCCRYGSSNLEAAYIDEVLDAVEAIKLKYLVLIYQNKLVGALKRHLHNRGVPAEPASARSAEKLMALIHCCDTVPVTPADPVGLKISAARKHVSCRQAPGGSRKGEGGWG